MSFRDIVKTQIKLKSDRFWEPTTAKIRPRYERDFFYTQNQYEFESLRFFFEKIRPNLNFPMKLEKSEKSPILRS
jgi:hypothetical protein